MSYVDTSTRQGDHVFKVQLYKLMILFGLGMILGVFACGFLIFPSVTPGPMVTIVFLSPIIAAVGGLIMFARFVKEDNQHYHATLAKEKAAMQAEKSRPPTEQEITQRRSTFGGLSLGISTGKLLQERRHSSGIAPEEDVFLSPEDCSKNIIAFGGIGSGKTTRFVNPMLKQILEQDAGALIFNIKGDFLYEANELAKQANREFKIIGYDGLTLNLIGNTTPELAASFLKSCFLRQGASGESQIWSDSATEFCRNCLNLIKLTDGDYSLAGLFDVSADESLRKKTIEEMESRFEEYDRRDKRLVLATSQYFSAIWEPYDDKLKTSVMFSVNSILSPFSHPDMVDAFSSSEGENEADLIDLINKGDIFLVNIPRTRFGREGSRFAYMLIKLRFFSMMQERRTNLQWNQSRPVAFICDEYQEIVDTISDSNFWDKSRSSKTIGIVTMQGVASLVLELNSNEKAAEAILQNFRQRIVFRTEDEATLRHVQQLLGQVDVLLESTGESYNEGESTSSAQNSVHGGGTTLSVNTSYSENTGTSISRQDLFSANDMRQLGEDYALLIGNIGPRAADEILKLDPIFIN